MAGGFFLLKWTGVTTLWLNLKRIFPASTEKAKWICLLFAFYPGNLILFQPLVFIVAVLQINLFFLSFLLTILAIQQPQRKWLYLFLALAASLMNLVASEYFFFPELLRPAVIWTLLAHRKQTKNQRLRKSLLAMAALSGGFRRCRSFGGSSSRTLSSIRSGSSRILSSSPVNPGRFS